jgi:transposase
LFGKLIWTRRRFFGTTYTMSSTKPSPHTIPPELEAEMTPAVRAFVESLLERLRNLEARVGLNPQNSSLPPSTQHPHARPQPPKRKSKKKRGGQPGHEKHERPLIPTEECDDVQACKPTECRRCSEELSGSDPEPLRHQVWELPEIKPHVTEFQLHRLECAQCGATTCGELPVGVPQGQSGPRLMAFTALLMAFYRQSKRRTAEFLSTVLGQPCCPALTVKIQNQVTEALRPSYEALAAQLPMQEQLSIDETPTKEENGKAWLWTFVAQMFTVFAVRATREATALGVFLGEKFHGVVNCDRAKMYWYLGASETGLSSLDRQPRPAGEAVGARPDAADAETLRGVGALPRWDAHPYGNETPDDTDPRGDRRLAAARRLQRQRAFGRHVRRIV